MKSRTDEIFATVDIDKQKDAFINLCRQLETELTESKINADGILRQFKELHNEYDELKNLAMRLRVFAIHYGAHPKRNYQGKLEETLGDFDKMLVDFDRIMDGN